MALKPNIYYYKYELEWILIYMYMYIKIILTFSRRNHVHNF